MQNDRHPFIMLFYQIKLTEQIAQPRTLLFAQIRDFLSSHFPHDRLMKSQALRNHLHYPKNSNFQRPFLFLYKLYCEVFISTKRSFNFSRNLFSREVCFLASLLIILTFSQIVYYLSELFQIIITVLMYVSKSACGFGISTSFSFSSFDSSEVLILKMY